MKKVVFYVEGGGNPDADTALRQAFHKFFNELDEQGKANGYALTYKLCGSRRLTYEIFCFERGRDPDSTHLLLVDSEAPVATPGACWQHLKDRPGDGWERPDGATDADCHLMVQAMEAWFFADPDALAKFYKQNFNANALPKTQNVEDIPKSRHIDALEAATKATQKKRYHKTRHAPQILEALDPVKVRRRAPHCERLFATVAALIGASV